MEKLKPFIKNPIYMAILTFLSSLIIVLALRFGLEFNKINLEHIIIIIAMICFYIYVKTFKTGSIGMPKDFRVKYSTITILLFLCFKVFEIYYLTSHSIMPDIHIFIRKTLIQAALGGYSMYFISGKFVKRKPSDNKNIIVETQSLEE